MNRQEQPQRVHFLLSKLEQIVGPEGLVSAPEDKRQYDTDWLKKWQGDSCVVVRPATTLQVSQVMRLCYENQTPVVTQGGNTGMSGGATPDISGAQVLLSLSRMNKIREVDPLNNSMCVEAGVILAQVQKAAEQVQRYFPLSLGSEGSCTIGGNLATNAGGIAVLRYGNMRDMALGLEVVLPDGRIWNGLRALRKDNTGYDLRDLFIGSEGTLGVITAAVLKLFPRLTTQATAWVGASSMSALLHMLSVLYEQCGQRLVAFEMMSAEALDLVQQHVPASNSPLQGQHAFHALIELADTHTDSLTEMLETCLEQGVEKGYIDDAILCMSLSQRQELWKIREGISEAQVRAGHCVKHDIALPISALDEFVVQASAAVSALSPGLRLINFGHMGDGNLHFNVLLPGGLGSAEIKTWTQTLNKAVHGLVHQYQGSISAEHGVGQLRRDELRIYKNPVELELMMLLKQTLDQNQIMNPGKLL